MKAVAVTVAEVMATVNVFNWIKLDQILFSLQAEEGERAKEVKRRKKSAEARGEKRVETLTIFTGLSRVFTAVQH